MKRPLAKTLPCRSEPKPLLIVVADDPTDRLAIQRAFQRCEFRFASTIDEAEALARASAGAQLLHLLPHSLRS